LSQKKGLVMRSTGSWYEVRDEAEHVWQCRLKGKFKIKGLKVTNPIAVGDRVHFDVEDEVENMGTIYEILPRTNYLIRKSVHKTAHGHLLATNIDQLVLIVTMTFPRTSLGFIDRFLVSAESFRIPAVLIFNKQDILTDDEVSLQQEHINLYESLGYECLQTSATAGTNMDAFIEKLAGKVSLISGHSGVGKSTLINFINPELDLATSEVSTFANKGVHTTTFAEMFEITPGTFLIDTPGIKELGLMEIEKAELGHYFPEMRKLLNQCRFDNCIHYNEPGCAVKESVGEGAIAESRYMSYLSMFEGGDNRR
jgi:ribosome biogenesis GTPase